MSEFGEIQYMPYEPDPRKGDLTVPAEFLDENGILTVPAIPDTDITIVDGDMHRILRIEGSTTHAPYAGRAQTYRKQFNLSVDGHRPVAVKLGGASLSPNDDGTVSTSLVDTDGISVAFSKYKE